MDTPLTTSIIKGRDFFSGLYRFAPELEEFKKGIEKNKKYKASYFPYESSDPYDPTFYYRVKKIEEVPEEIYDALKQMDGLKIIIDTYIQESY